MKENFIHNGDMRALLVFRKSDKSEKFADFFVHKSCLIITARGQYKKRAIECSHALSKSISYIAANIS